MMKIMQEGLDSNPNHGAHVEIVGEVVRYVGANVQRVLHVLPLIRRRVNPELGAVPLRVLFPVVKVADDEAGEVRDHGHALLESHRRQPLSRRVGDLKWWK